MRKESCDVSILSDSQHYNGESAAVTLQLVTVRRTPGIRKRHLRVKGMKL
jgi:hypothetical protein